MIHLYLLRKISKNIIIKITIVIIYHNTCSRIVSVAVVVGIGVIQLINLSPSMVVLLLCLHLHHQHRSSCFPFSFSGDSFSNYLILNWRERRD